MASLASLLGTALRSFSELEKSKRAIDMIVCAALTFFGVKSIYGALQKSSHAALQDAFSSVVTRPSPLLSTGAWNWSIFWKIFSLVLSAEFGDRSFMSTLALSSASSPLHILLGTVLAHTTTTLIAVNGGVLLAAVVSEQTAGIIGGLVFLAYAAIMGVHISNSAPATSHNKI
jgi:putative Ca2+/H+ antiporter (TMEM165/GDT1 family)